MYVQCVAGADATGLFEKASGGVRHKGVAALQELAGVEGEYAGLQL